VCLERHEIVLSDYIIEELRKHLSGKFKIPQSRSTEILAFLRQQAVLVKPADVDRDACRDPKDLMILGTAVAAQANFLVIGDNDLLTLAEFDSIPILSPRQFYRRLG
jgi:putative PIN family toxin of toxin-antitoxin system